MFSWFTEDPTFPVATGFFLVVCLLGLAAYSREKLMLYGALACASLCVFTLVIEFLIVTDKEQVTEALYDIEQTVRDNEFQKTLSYIMDEETKKAANGLLSGVVCEQCNIIGFNKIEVNSDASPATAIADFAVFGKVNKYPNPFTLQVVLDMQEQSDGTWKMREYQLLDPRSKEVLRSSK